MKIELVACFFLLTVVGMLATTVSSPILAQEEKIELDVNYPVIESATPGDSLKFTVALKYRGSQARTFDLRTSGPPGWTTYITSSDGYTRISAIKLDPNKEYPERVKVIASPSPSAVPERTEYKIALEASSGAIRASIELTAALLPTYSLELVLSPTPYYHKAVTAGKYNLFFADVKNTGSGALSNIRFSADKPAGWVVEFKPEKIDSLTAGSFEKVEVNVKPPAESAAEYYQVTLIAEANQSRRTVNVDMPVEKPKGAWVWVGVVTAFLVIAGFTVIFLRLNRRN